MCALLIAQNTPGKAGRAGFVLRMGALDTGSDSCLLQNSPIVQHPLPRHHAPPPMLDLLLSLVMKMEKLGLGPNEQ